MDTRKNTENQIITRETCPICGIRRRKSNCLVCLECNDSSNNDFGEISRLRAELETKNEDAILDERFDNVVDVWNEIFIFVLKKGKQTFENKRTELSQAIKLRNAKLDKLRDRAEGDISVRLGTLAKKGKYFAKDINRESLVEKQFEKLKSNEKIFGRVYALGKCITALNKQLKGIQKKREEHLAEVKENSTESTVAVA